MERTAYWSPLEMDDDELEALERQIESDDDYSEARRRKTYVRPRASNPSRELRLLKTQVRDIKKSVKKDQQKFQLIAGLAIFIILRDNGVLAFNSAGAGVNAGLGLGGPAALNNGLSLSRDELVLVGGALYLLSGTFDSGSDGWSSLLSNPIVVATLIYVLLNLTPRVSTATDSPGAANQK